MGIVANLLNKLEASELTAAQNPSLIHALEELSKKAGLDYVPKIHIISKGKLAEGPLAGALGPKHIVLSEHMLKLFNVTSSHTPEEMKAILAHELSHVKNNLRDIGLTRLPVLLAPIAATLGYHFYRKATKGADTHEAFHENLNKIVQSEHDDLHASAQNKTGLDKEMHSTADSIITAAKYAAVFVAGLGAGLLAARQFSLAFEYMADTHGAKLVSKDAMSNALKIVEGDLHRIHGQNNSHFSLAKLIQNTILAHPALDDRLANIAR